MFSQQQLEQLKAVRSDLTVYNAGLPRFPRNFTRDGIIAGLIMDDAQMLRDQVEFCALHQGQKYNPDTGEEPGKVHHEWPGFTIEARNRTTTYNACDSTAFFLIGLARYIELTDDTSFANQLKPAVEKGVAYILSHLNSNFHFEESPHLFDAGHFALKVTYWKDSVILDRPNGEPDYPAVFTLAHIQNACGLRHAAKLLNDPALKESATNMIKALSSLYDHELGTFYTAVDARGPIRAVTSDALHALFYLQPGDISQTWVDKIERSSEQLETSVGYAVMTPEDAVRMQRAYHASAVWPFEQALIARGAANFGLERVQRVCLRTLRTLQNTFPELVSVQITEPDISCNPQLWSIAAYRYFKQKADD